MINIYIVLGILFIHWFADFVCQTDKEAKNKSTSWKALLSHTIFYSFIWLAAITFYGAITNSSIIILLFVPITFVIHTATDYYTSRVNKVLWDNKEVHNFFVSIGFDQFLHFTQLLLTFYLLTK